jgi:hypothetical protein
MADALSQRPGGYAAAISETTRFLNERLPGLVHDKTRIYESAEELLASPYARGRTFSEKELAGIRSAEGFFDPKTGDSIVIANNVSLHPGETPHSALARVILHERVGHDGINALIKSNTNFAKQWTDFTAKIPEAELTAIGQSEGYRNLAGNRDALAFEWFARKVEGNKALLTQPGLVQRMWNALRAFIADKQTQLGFDASKGRSFEDQTLDLIHRARRQSVDKGGTAALGENLGTPGDGSHLQFSIAAYNAIKKRLDKPASWTDIDAGHSLKQIWSLFPKSDAERGRFFTRGKLDEVVHRVAKWLPSAGETRDPWGASVNFNNPQKEGVYSEDIKNRAAHLIGNTIEGTRPEKRTLSLDKLQWFGSTKATIENAQIRMIASNGDTLYFRSYGDGIHMVIVEDGIVKDQYGLISQFALDKPGKRSDAVVERVR